VLGCSNKGSGKNVAAYHSAGVCRVRSRGEEKGVVTRRISTEGGGRSGFLGRLFRGIANQNGRGSLVGEQQRKCRAGDKYFSEQHDKGRSHPLPLGLREVRINCRAGNRCLCRRITAIGAYSKRTRKIAP